MQKRPKLDIVLGKCSREDLEEQPLYIDEGCIQCLWCPSWKGSSQTKVINQHTKKSASHLKARRKNLNLPESDTPGRQIDIRSFFS